MLVLHRTHSQTLCSLSTLIPNKSSVLLVALSMIYTNDSLIFIPSFSLSSKHQTQISNGLFNIVIWMQSQLKMYKTEPLILQSSPDLLLFQSFLSQ